MSERLQVTPSEIRVGDVLVNPHYHLMPRARVTRVAQTWYGASIYYESIPSDGSTYVSAFFDETFDFDRSFFDLRRLGTMEIERE